MEDFARRIERSAEFAGEIVHAREMPAAPASYQEPRRALSDELRAAAARYGAARLYAHQARALEILDEGRDVAVVTPTASGKSLVFYLPTAGTLARDGGHALYIFPHKALEQDQLKKLREFGQGLMGLRNLTVEIYDGDTPAGTRKKIRAAPPDVLITNPDMLHMGILAYHGEWARFFGQLRLVVIDELHVYRGIFGSHFAHVMRRLARVAAHYGADPRYLACSATVGNPGPFAETLLARPFEVVSESGAPRAPRRFLFVNPRGSPYMTATRLFLEAIKAGHRTIAFTKARKITELMHSWAVEQADPSLARRIAPYRAGYLPEERRAIERKLFDGELAGVIATSALELGIDVGGLDVCILVGYPGSIMSSWQRIGRVGRQGRESLVILVAQPDALDQYFMTHPEQFFERGFERAVVDPTNPAIAGPHLVCAGAELPLSREEAEREVGPQGVSDLVASGRLASDEAQERYYSLKRRPHRDVNLRSGGESYSILADEGERSIGTIDGVRVFHECHEGAIYLHGGTTYRIVRLDRETKQVLAVPFSGDYYTQALGEKETEILETHGTQERGPFQLSIGRLKVTVRIQEYARKRLRDQSTISKHPIEVPPIVFETIGFWMTFPDALEEEIITRGLHFMGGLHGSEHAMISLFPLLALCDRGDVGGISYSRNPQLGAPAIFIYDGYPGGIGLAASVHGHIEDLLGATRALLADCPCDEGCPSCVQSPRCGSGNRPLDKQAARLVLLHLLGQSASSSVVVQSGTNLVQFPARPEALGTPRVAPLPPPPKHPMLRDPRQAAGAEIHPTSSPNEAVRAEIPHTLFEAPFVLRQGDGRVLVFDVETRKSAEEVGGWGKIRDMGLALAVVYDVGRNEAKTYFEEDVERLVLDLVMADRVIGYNSERFDFTVLSGYGAWDFTRIRSFDMLSHIKDRLGFRLKLGDLAESNLGIGKSADGLQSLQWFKEGRLDLIEQYCRQDVAVTARLYFLGRERGYLLFRGRDGVPLRIPTDW